MTLAPAYRATSVIFFAYCDAHESLQLTVKRLVIVGAWMGAVGVLPARALDELNFRLGAVSI